MNRQSNKHKSESSIFTDESLDEEMKGTDKLWYNNLDHKKKKDDRFRFINDQKLIPGRSDTKGSAEQYKNMMSISSGNDMSSVKYIPMSTVMNLNQDPSKFPHFCINVITNYFEIEPGEMFNIISTLKHEPEAVFKSKVTFQNKWHN